ncbi:MAG: hypothetical protein COA73_07990 [Candidatus Hydrogenedentota bacterium]|nr:MAG: hypothetical protein COA73_07990 [Candidatus Hydrogenedentota bacterium]
MGTMLLALFPLQLIIFPGEEIPLHIFESRYRQLIAECRDEGIAFGMPLAMDGKISQYGTEVELVKIIRTYETGEMDIVVRGKRIFKIDDVVTEVPDKLYSGAMISWLDIDATFDEAVQENVLRKFKHALKLANKEFPIPSPIPANISYIITPKLGLTPAQKLEILSANPESKRQEILLRHLDRVIEALKKKTDSIKLGQSGAGSAQYFSQN